MSEKPDMGEWGEVTIRTPGAFANVEDMHRVMSELFCHDSVLAYQQRTTESGMREAVAELRTAFKRATERRGDVPADLIQLAENLLDRMDPDHEEWGGYFPSQMVCPLHGQPGSSKVNGHGRMLPVLKACPGVPRCRAHEGVRVE